MKVLKHVQKQCKLIPNSNFQQHHACCSFFFEFFFLVVFVGSPVNDMPVDLKRCWHLIIFVMTLFWLKKKWSIEKKNNLCMSNLLSLFLWRWSYFFLHVWYAPHTISTSSIYLGTGWHFRSQIRSCPIILSKFGKK